MLNINCRVLQGHRVILVIGDALANTVVVSGSQLFRECLVLGCHDHVAELSAFAVLNSHGVDVR